MYTRMHNCTQSEQGHKVLKINTDLHTLVFACRNTLISTDTYHENIEEYISTHIMMYTRMDMGMYTRMCTYVYSKQGHKAENQHAA